MNVNSKMESVTLINETFLIDYNQPSDQDKKQLKQRRLMKRNKIDKKN